MSIIDQINEKILEQCKSFLWSAQCEFYVIMNQKQMDSLIEEISVKGDNIKRINCIQNVFGKTHIVLSEDYDEIVVSLRLLVNNKNK